MLDALLITRLHDEANVYLHRSDSLTTALPEPADFFAYVSLQHHANFDLWHEEDKARDPSATDAEIVRVKHAIDRLNQQRNDLVEKIDEWLLNAIPAQNPLAPLNSETPGLMIDRLSILALKIYHTREEAHRPTASEAHHQRNVARLALLEEQRTDLANCLDALWAAVQSGERRFKLYRQLKMYNDPELNPAVYRRAVPPSGS
jgi:hypothetical protein